MATWDVNDAGPAALEAEIAAAGGSGWFQKVDVAKAGEVAAAVAAIVERWGGIAVLVNNAGIVRDAYVWLASDAASWITGQTVGVDGGLVVGT